MAARRKWSVETETPGSQLRARLIEHLRDRVAMWTERHAGREWDPRFPTMAEHVQRDLDRLEAGEAVTLHSTSLPDPWRSEWRPARRVVVMPDGSVVEDPYGRT